MQNDVSLNAPDEACTSCKTEMGLSEPYPKSGTHLSPFSCIRETF